ncbi:MAG: DUF6879 family protein [Pseudonocardiaceae bacterium]
MAKVLRDAACPVGKTCPRIERTDGGYNIVGTNIPDDGLPAHERKVHVPATMLPELGALDIPDFETWLQIRRTSPGDMLRIQTLDRYGVPSDDADFAGYLEGAPAPTSPYQEPFFQELHSGVAAKMRWRNLHVVRQPLSDYLRYAFEWVYTYSSDAGQDIRILDLGEQPAGGVLQRTGDFWVVEHQHVALVRYDDQGRHQGEVAVKDTSATGYIAAAELAWHLGVPFTDWWAAHPQYRRATQAA